MVGSGGVGWLSQTRPISRSHDDNNSVKHLKVAYKCHLYQELAKVGGKKGFNVFIFCISDVTLAEYVFQ